MILQDQKKNDKLAVLFEEWSGAGEDWGRSEMITQMRSKDKHRVKGCRKWLTLAEITAKYNDAEVAWDICRLKLESETLSKSQVRFHPDLPGRDDMRQYLVYDYAEEVDQHDSVLESLFRCEDADSGTDHKRRRRGRSPEKKRKRQKKNKKVSSSSSTASSASRSSSQSSSQQSNQTRRTAKTTKGKKNKKDRKGRRDKEMTNADRMRVEKEQAREDEKEKKKLEKEEAKRQKEEEKAQEKARKKLEAEQKREAQKQKEKKRSAAKKV